MSDLDAFILDLDEAKKQRIVVLCNVFLTKYKFKRTSIKRKVIDSTSLKPNAVMDENRKENFKKYLKKIGIGGVVFFTVKGCISLYIILTLGKCAIG